MKRFLVCILIVVMLVAGLPTVSIVAQAEDISHLTPVEVTLDSSTMHTEEDIPMTGTIERLYKITINEDGIYYFSASSDYWLAYSYVCLMKEQSLENDSIISYGRDMELSSVFEYLKKGETYYVYMKNDQGGDSIIYEGKTVDVSLYRDNDTKIIDNVWYRKGTYSIRGSAEPVNCYAVTGNSFVGGETSLTILDEIDGADVNLIQESAFQNTSLEQVVLGKNIVEIDSFAFSGCQKLSSVVFPDSLKLISSYAFSNTALPDITLSKNLEYLSATVFLRCYNMKNVYVDEGSEYFTSIDGVLYSKDKTKLVLYPTGHGNSYDVVEGTTTIGSEAFYQSKIKEISFPSTLTKIQIHAFSQCEKLAFIEFPEGLTSIGQGAFSYCTSLVSLVYPKSVTDARVGVFEGCSRLESVIIRSRGCNITYDQNFDVGLSEDLTIYGYKGSSAQGYAEDAGVNFVDITRDEQTECEHIFVPYQVIKKSACLEEGLGTSICAVCGTDGENVAIKPLNHEYSMFYPFCVECLTPRDEGGDFSIGSPINVRLVANKTAAYKYQSTQNALYELSFANCTKEMDVWVVVMDENYDIKLQSIYTVGKSPLLKEIQLSQGDYLMVGFEYFPEETAEGANESEVEVALSLKEIIFDSTPTPALTPTPIPTPSTESSMLPSATPSVSQTPAPSATPKVKVGKAKIKSAKNVKKKTIVVKIAKTKNAKKYKVQYALNKKFKKAKSKTTARRTYKIKKLKKGKKYFVRVRGVNGKLRGAWSKVKKVKIRK